MIFSTLKTLDENANAFTLITLVAARGSVPQVLGAKCVVTHNGIAAGTIGGGKIEARAIEYSQNQLAKASALAPEIITWNLQKDIGMTCGGEVTLLFEFFIPRAWNIAIFGAGHVSQALIPILSTLNCHITCIDPREDWLDKFTQRKNVKLICHQSPSECVKLFDHKTYFLSLTQGHAFDVPILHEIAQRFPEASYVGVIGSDTKGKKIRSELQELGVTQAFVEKIKVPLGLPIGNSNPSEIAISICAQLLQVRDQN